MWHILIRGPGYFDTPYELNDGFTTLGRAEGNDIVLSGDSVSRRHVSVRVKEDQVWVDDLESRNGSTLNGKALGKGAVVRHGDVVTIGENTITFRKGKPDTGPSSLGIRRTGAGEQSSPAIVLTSSLKQSQILGALDNLAVPSGAPPDGAPSPVAFDALLTLYQIAEKLSA
jgi:adenylate cyclase